MKLPRQGYTIVGVKLREEKTLQSQLLEDALQKKRTLQDEGFTVQLFVTYTLLVT